MQVLLKAIFGPSVLVAWGYIVFFNRLSVLRNHKKLFLQAGSVYCVILALGIVIRCLMSAGLIAVDPGLEVKSTSEHIFFIYVDTVFLVAHAYTIKYLGERPEA